MTEPQALRKQFETIRKTGYAVSNQELETDYVAVAAEFRGPLGEVAGAISVGGPVRRFPGKRIQQLGRQLREAADDLSQKG